jgi:hypothetical protein
MEAIFSFETSVDFQRTTRRYIPEDSTLHNYLCENLKSCRLHFACSEIMNRKLQRNVRSRISFEYFIDNANISRKV